MLPLSRAAYTKLGLFILMMTGLALGGLEDLTTLLLASIPLALCVVGIGLAHLRRSASYVRRVGNILSSLFVFLSAVFGIIAVHAWSRYESVDGQVVAIVVIVLLFLATATQLLYTNALNAHVEWVARNGLGWWKPKARPGIVKMENFRSYSVADELAKWSKLRDQGVISAEEFEAAKKNLLG